MFRLTLETGAYDRGMKKTSNTKTINNVNALTDCAVTVRWIKNVYGGELVTLGVTRVNGRHYFRETIVAEAGSASKLAAAVEQYASIWA